MNEKILAQKQADVEALAAKMKESSSVVMVEYRGLSVKEATDLRRELRGEDVEFKVYKNGIASRAAKSLGLDEFSEAFVGPNALAFGKDPVAPARVLAKFAKDHEALVLKTGVIDGEMVDEETIKKLSALPNKEGMLAKFASCLNAPLIQFAMTLKAVAEAKENGSFEVKEAVPAQEEAKEEAEAEAPAQEEVKEEAAQEAAAE